MPPVSSAKANVSDPFGNKDGFFIHISSVRPRAAYTCAALTMPWPLATPIEWTVESPAPVPEKFTEPMPVQNRT
jgi:hypothetical protein